MPVLHLSLDDARTLHLAAQGLATPPAKPATRADLARCIRRMQLLQIDTIHVVNRSPYLVLFARLGAYPTEWLEQLLARGTIFETWAHEACFAPIEDWALHRGYNAERRHWGMNGAQRVYRSHRTHMHTLLDHIRMQGAVKSSDFERTDGQSGGWWGWKNEKRWLEAWFALGELMVARRENFQRVYDLTERVHPEAASLPKLTVAEAQAQMTERAIKAVGITQARWVNDYFRTKPKLKDRDLAPLLDAGVIERVQIENWREPAYVHREHLALARKVLRGALAATHTTLLSPFDPVVWDRERASTLFGFDYRIECYTPEPKRKYGYFVLPILHCNALVGRLDAKAHRSESVFEVKALHWEADAAVDEAVRVAVARALIDSAAWHGCSEVRLGSAVPLKARRAMNAALKAAMA